MNQRLEDIVRNGFGVNRIVVGLDGSEESHAAASTAAAVAGAFDAAVIGVHATGLLDVWPTSTASDRNSHVHVRELLHGAWSEPLRTSGARLQLVLRDGPPADVLLAIADEVDADLIVVGNRGAGDTPLGELGSTSGKIVRRCHRAVLVVPLRQQVGDD
jgi:nucleotide-binding universal stress UspA family protein